MPPQPKSLQKSNKNQHKYIVIVHCKEIFTCTIKIYIYFNILGQFLINIERIPLLMEIWRNYQ